MPIRVQQPCQTTDYREVVRHRTCQDKEMPGEIVVGKPVQDTTVSERKTLLSLLLIPPGVKIRPFPGTADSVGGLLTILLDGILSGLRRRAIR